MIVYSYPLADPEGGGPGDSDPPPPLFQIHLHYFMWQRKYNDVSVGGGSHGPPSFDFLLMFHIKERGIDFYF